MKNYVWYDNGITFLSLLYILIDKLVRNFRKINTKKNLAWLCVDFILMHSNVHICFVFYFHWINGSGFNKTWY